MTPELRRRLDEHRRIRQSELFDLADLLRRRNLTPDPGPLQGAGEQCMAEPRPVPAGLPGAGRARWGYRIEGLRLRLEPQRHCRPRAADVQALVGALTVDVQEYVPATPGEVGDSYANVRTLGASFACDAVATLDGEEHMLRSAWHVDTHLHATTKGGPVHPRFHFQAGGEEMDAMDDQIRGALLLEAPRPATPPLDGVLAVDFVLSHYCGGAWSSLRETEPAYGRLRGPAMARYWEPWFRSIADALRGDAPIGCDDPAGLLVPNLVLS